MKRWFVKLLKNRRKMLGLLTIAITLAVLFMDGWRIRTSRLETALDLTPSSELFFYPLRFTPLASAELSLQDILLRNGRRTVPNPDLIFLAQEAQAMQSDMFEEADVATQPALKQMQNQWPFPRSVWAEVCKRLIDAGAKIVILDFIFPRSGLGDAELKKVLNKYPDKIVVGTLFEKVEVSGQDGTSLIYGLPPESILPPEHSKEITAYVNFWVDPIDELIRHAYYQLTGSQVNGHQQSEGEEIQSSIAARTAIKLGQAEHLPKTIGVGARLRFTGPKSTFKTAPVWQIFDSKMWKANFQNGEFFKGKVVVVGPFGAISKDELLTPLGLIPGPELHLNAINALIHGEFLEETTSWQNASLVIGSAALAWLASLFILSPSGRFLIGLFLSAVYFYIAFYLYNTRGLFIPIIPPLLTLNSIHLFGLTYEFILERIEKARVRSTFERYVSRNVVREILDKREDFENLLGGKRKDVTILFSDIRGFTTMTESADSTALVERLNEYLSAMVRCVYKTDGTLDKFIGDAVMAVWGNVVSTGTVQDGEHAIDTALDMLKELRRLNEKWVADGLIKWEIGIGLNHGEVIVGNMGASEKMEFTVIGDAVNLASRLESLTKEYGLELIIGESLAALIKDKYHLQSVDLVAVKGKTKPVEVFAVLGKLPDPLSEKLAVYHQAFEEGVRLFRGKKFAEALEKFRACETAKPGDYLSTKVYPERCAYNLANPPAADWDGVHRMKSK